MIALFPARGRRALAGMILLAAALPQRGLACEAGIVRDAAFDQPRDLYRLCILAPAGAPAADRIQHRLQAWLDAKGAALNLKIVRVPADDPDVDWSQYAIPSAPPEMPVVVLVGKRPENGSAFFVDYWEPAPTDEQLQLLRESPARTTLRRELIRRLAVVVHLPGVGTDSEQVASLIERVCQEHLQQPLGVTSITIDRHDPAERLVASFAGVPPDGPDWVGVAFGRGKFMAPLEGERIHESQLHGLLDMVAADCTCSQTPSRLGVDLLMEWPDEMDEALVRIAEPAETPALPLAVVPVAGADASAAVPPATGQLSALIVWLVSGLMLLSAAGSALILWRR